MSLLITEIFGYAASDTSTVARAQRRSEICPFLNRTCWKRFRNGGVVSGACAVKPPTSEEVIICPDRLYAENFRILHDIVVETFGPSMRLIGPTEIGSSQGEENRIVAFGKRWGKELRVPKSAESAGGYAADWVLVRISASAVVEEFVPVEVQTMDTTGSYQGEWYRMHGLDLPTGCVPTNPSINWENVNKRIIPQLLTKGNVFGRETLCRKGLFFVCPSPVYKKLMERLGARLSSWPMRSGALTFRWYDLGEISQPGEHRLLRFQGQFTTTIENLKEAFNSTLNLPSMGVMAETIQKAINDSAKPKRPRSRSRRG
jgi:Restriction endonuclease NotI